MTDFDCLRKNSNSQDFVQPVDLRLPIPASPKRNAESFSNVLQVRALSFLSSSKGRYASSSMKPRKLPDSRKLAGMLLDMWQLTEKRHWSLKACLVIYNLYLPARRLIITNQICGVSLANRTEMLDRGNDAVRSPCHRNPAPLKFKTALMEVLFWKVADSGGCVPSALESPNFQTVFSHPLSMKWFVATTQVSVYLA